MAAGHRDRLARLQPRWCRVSREEHTLPVSQDPAGDERVRQAADAFAKAMFRDAEFGLLLRLVRAEIDDQERTNCERYISDDAEASFARQMSRLRTVERKLRQQREALRGNKRSQG